MHQNLLNMKYKFFCSLNFFLFFATLVAGKDHATTNVLKRNAITVELKLYYSLICVSNWTLKSTNSFVNIQLRMAVIAKSTGFRLYRLFSSSVKPGGKNRSKLPVYKITGFRFFFFKVLYSQLLFSIINLGIEKD